MSLNPNQEIGNEKHHNQSQFIRVEEGNGKAIIQNKKYLLKEGDCVIIPPNTWHNIVGGSTGMKLYTIYCGPEHSPDTVDKIKLK
jgi:mannose-6-phosphate isomerase-like protein (cupin superfamily)